MKNNIKSIFLCFLCLMFGVQGNVFSATHALEVLKMPMGARALGMGEACTALNNSKTGMYYNPAGISGEGEVKKISTSYQSGLVGDKFGIVDYTLPIKGDRHVGLGLIYYDAGTVELIDKYGGVKSISALQDIVGIASISQKLFSWVYFCHILFGANIKIVNSKLAGEFSDTAVAGDVGIILKRDKYSAGVSVQNVGGKITYDSEENSLPFTARIGFSYNIRKHISTNLDLVSIKDESLKVNLGTEYLFKKKYFIRGGYKIGYDLDSLCLGFGFQKNKMRVDYGFGLRGELGQVHLFTISRDFE